MAKDDPGGFVDPLGRRIKVEDGHLQADREVCDFCLADNRRGSTRRRRCRSRATRSSTPARTSGAACEECHRLLQQHSLGALVKRCVIAHEWVAAGDPRSRPAARYRATAVPRNLLRFMHARTGPPPRYR